MSPEYFSQLSMQLQSPEAITQMASSPYDPWAIMTKLAQKYSMPAAQPQAPAQGQPGNIGAILNGSMGMMQPKPQQQMPMPKPMALPMGGKPAPVPQPMQMAPQQRLDIGQLLSRGPGYGL